MKKANIAIFENDDSVVRMLRRHTDPNTLISLAVGAVAAEVAIDGLESQLDVAIVEAYLDTSNRTTELANQMIGLLKEKFEDVVIIATTGLDSLPSADIQIDKLYSYLIPELIQGL